MGKVFAEITMSIDGFIAGPGISNQQPMGVNGPKLHEWLFDKATDADKQWLDELIKTSGAVITGNHTYRTAIDDAWGGGSPFIIPAFVLCHTSPSKKINGFEYIIGGMHEALDKAKDTAKEKNIWIMGGANVIQQYIKADTRTKLITGYKVTSANIADNDVVDELLDKKEDSGQPLHGDSAYSSKELEELYLEKGIISKVNQQGYRNKKITLAQQKRTERNQRSDVVLNTYLDLWKTV